MRALRVVAVGAVSIGLLLPASAAHAETKAESIDRIVREAKRENHLRAVIVRVTKGDKVVTSQAYGTSLDGVRATTRMRFRNGAVAFAYVSTLLLKYVDQGKVSLDDTIDEWLPGLPNADRVTLKMLANQTSGYPDYERDTDWVLAFEQNPFREWTYKERVKIAFSKPVLFEPGTNWSYSHTNFMLLGRILAKVGGAPLATLLKREVLKPMGLKSTVANQSSEIPAPVLHAFSSERRGYLGLPATTRFYEETTHWNTAWGTPVGATQTTDIVDLARSARAIGTGKLLSKKSYRAMTKSRLIGFGQRQDNCAPSCFTQVVGYNYGLGIVRSGAWMLQNPLLSGYAATMAYLPKKDVAIAVSVTFGEKAFDAEGSYPNASDGIFREIGALMAPKDAPPVKR
ncbi:MAG: serine hydrolase domain-containing protein [Candidatus Nanopelagicales bacterium]|nr:beta-lactamase family protein [Actinomycetota bacterium]MCB0921352.1 beta-lactamase family protein [Actinomycetota bacterium]